MKLYLKSWLLKLINMCLSVSLSFPLFLLPHSISLTLSFSPNGIMMASTHTFISLFIDVA